MKLLIRTDDFDTLKTLLAQMDVQIANCSGAQDYFEKVALRIRQYVMVTKVRSQLIEQIVTAIQENRVASPEFWKSKIKDYNANVGSDPAYNILFDEINRLFLKLWNAQIYD